MDTTWYAQFDKLIPDGYHADSVNLAETVLTDVRNLTTAEPVVKGDKYNKYVVGSVWEFSHADEHRNVELSFHGETTEFRIYDTKTGRTVCDLWLDKPTTGVIIASKIREEQRKIGPQHFQYCVYLNGALIGECHNLFQAKATIDKYRSPNATNFRVIEFGNNEHPASYEPNTAASY